MSRLLYRLGLTRVRLERFVVIIVELNLFSIWVCSGMVRGCFVVVDWIGLDCMGRPALTFLLHFLLWLLPVAFIRIPFGRKPFLYLDLTMFDNYFKQVEEQSSANDFAASQSSYK